MKNRDNLFESASDFEFAQKRQRRNRPNERHEEPKRLDGKQKRSFAEARNRKYGSV